MTILLPRPSPNLDRHPWASPAQASQPPSQPIGILPTGIFQSNESSHAFTAANSVHKLEPEPQKSCQGHAAYGGADDYFHIGKIATKRDRLGHSVGGYPDSWGRCW